MARLSIKFFQPQVANVGTVAGTDTPIALKADSPQWFVDAVTLPRWIGSADFRGSAVEYTLWQDPEVVSDRPFIIFVHGLGAHMHWWDFLAPQLLDTYDVGAISMLGFGGSDRRDDYSAELYVDQVREVLYAMSPHASVRFAVGHSMGGGTLMRLAHSDEPGVQGIVVIDKAVKPKDFDWEAYRTSLPVGPLRKVKAYPDAATIHGRFRLMPPQSCANDYITDYIAWHSICRSEDGAYRWRFDDNLIRPIGLFDDYKYISNPRVPMDIMYGRDSVLCDPKSMEVMRQMLPDDVEMTVLPGAHHVILDSPIETVAYIRGVLRGWA